MDLFDKKKNTFMYRQLSESLRRLKQTEVDIIGTTNIPTQKEVYISFSSPLLLSSLFLTINVVSRVNATL